MAQLQPMADFYDMPELLAAVQAKYDEVMKQLVALQTPADGLAPWDKDHTIPQWAEETARRIVDEYYGTDDLGDCQLLSVVLAECFKRCPDQLQRLIGTGIIEESYFEELT
jgi:hypothetical protein